MSDLTVGIDIPVESQDVVKAARSVGNLASELRKIGNGTRAAASHFREMTTVARASASTTHGTMANMVSRMNANLSLLTTGAVIGWFGGLTTMALGAARAVGNLGIAIARGVVGVGQWMAGVGMFQETSLASLEVILKSKTLAAQLYKDAIDFAGATPFDTKEVVSGYKQLLSVGFGVDELRRTFTALGDLAASTGDPTALGRAITVMGQIRSLGKLTTEDLNQLSGMSLGKADVLTEVAKIMGTDLATASKDLERGAITSAVATEAILKAVERTRGGMMDVQSATLSGLLSSLASKPFEIVDKLKTSGGAVAKFYDTVKSTVQGLLKWLDTTGAKMGIERGLNATAAALTKLIQLTGAFVGGVWKGLTGEGDKFTGLADSIEKWDVTKLSAGFSEIGEKVGTLAGDLAVLSTNLVKLSENESLSFILRVFGGFAVDSLKAVIAVTEFVAQPFIRLMEVIGWVIEKFRSLKTEASSAIGLGSGFQLSSLFSTMTPALGGVGAGEGISTPIVRAFPSVSSPVPSGEVANGGSVVNNSYQISQSVSGGMMPEEIARLCRIEVKRALESTG
jgi:hypothetical protein